MYIHIIVFIEAMSNYCNHWKIIQIIFFSLCVRLTILQIGTHLKIVPNRHHSYHYNTTDCCCVFVFFYLFCVCDWLLNVGCRYIQRRVNQLTGNSPTTVWQPVSPWRNMEKQPAIVCSRHQIVCIRTIERGRTVSAFRYQHVGIELAQIGRIQW